MIYGLRCKKHGHFLFADGQKKKQGLDSIRTLLIIIKLKYLYGKNVVAYEAVNLCPKTSI
jgi:hypothetical protein